MAAARGSDGPSLDRRLRGDLDWIVLRALAADPDERYGSAAALADDLEIRESHLDADLDCDDTDPTNACAIIFGDGFESGDTSEWSSVS